LQPCQSGGKNACSDERSGELFSYVDLEDRVPAGHPLRLIRRIVNEVLATLDGEFTKLYGDGGRPSIAPERLLRALLLQVFYTIRSERQLMEQLNYNLLYRWLAGLGVDEPVWVPTVFTKKPRAAAGGGGCAQVPGRPFESQGGAQAFVGRTFFGRRHAGCGVGVDEERPRQGRLGGWGRRDPWTLPTRHPALGSSALTLGRVTCRVRHIRSR
jgi:Transposase domain (DUF772)